MTMPAYNQPDVYGDPDDAGEDDELEELQVLLEYGFIDIDEDEEP